MSFRILAIDDDDEDILALRLFISFELKRRSARRLEPEPIELIRLEVVRPSRLCRFALPSGW